MAGLTANEFRLRDRFAALKTSNVADVLDQMGLPDQGLAADFCPFPDGDIKIAGWAYTICGKMMPYSGTGDPEKMIACEGLSAGQISVWSGDGEGVCYFGELIALGMKERGCVGALVDGGIRDVHWFVAHKFPVFARYRTPVQSITRWKVTGWNHPVFLKGATTARITICPGDFVLGDADGVIIIPRNHVEAVLVEAERFTAGETKIREELSCGLSLKEALAKYWHV